MTNIVLGLILLLSVVSSTLHVVDTYNMTYAQAGLLSTGMHLFLGVICGGIFAAGYNTGVNLQLLLSFSIAFTPLAIISVGVLEILDVCCDCLRV